MAPPLPPPPLPPAYTSGQAEFTKALLASEHAYAWQCNACGFHAFALPGDEARSSARNVRDIMCKHDRKCKRGSSAAESQRPTQTSRGLGYP